METDQDKKAVHGLGEYIYSELNEKKNHLMPLKMGRRYEQKCSHRRYIDSQKTTENIFSSLIIRYMYIKTRTYYSTLQRLANVKNNRNHQC